MRIAPYFVISTICLSLSLQGQTGDKTYAAILDNPSHIFEARTDLIENAQKEILGSDFIHKADMYGLTKLALLREKARQGVKSKNIVDALHNQIPAAYLYLLQQEGVEFKNYNSFALSKLTKNLYRMHDKILVGDGKEVIGGDTNTADEYLQWGKSKMRSRDIYVRGNAARDARTYFMQLWNSDAVSIPQVVVTTDEEVAKQHELIKKRQDWVNFFIHQPRLHIDLDAPDVLSMPKVLYTSQSEIDEAKRLLDEVYRMWTVSKPLKGKSNSWRQNLMEVDDAVFLHDRPGLKTRQAGDIASVIENTIASARSSLQMESPYLILTPQMKDAIEMSARSGNNDIQILTNSINSNDNKMTQQAYEQQKGDVATLPVRVFEYPGPDTWHSKTVLQDGRVSIVGGFNLDYRSERLNTETAFLVKGKAFATRLGEMIKSDFQKSKLAIDNYQVISGAPPCSFLEISKGAILKFQL